MSFNFACEFRTRNTFMHTFILNMLNVMKTLTKKPTSLFMISLQNIESTNLFSICGYRNVTCFDKIDKKNTLKILRSDSEFKLILLRSIFLRWKLNRISYCKDEMKEKNSLNCSGNSTEAILGWKKRREINLQELRSF